MLITVVFVVFRRFQLLPAILFLLHQTGALLLCAMLQPNYDRRMNDFRTALFAFGAWTGFVFVILSFDGAHDPESLFAKIMSIALYIGILPSIGGGVYFSRYMWNTTTAAAWAKYQEVTSAEAGATAKADEPDEPDDATVDLNDDGADELPDLSHFDLMSLDDKLWMANKQALGEGIDTRQTLVFHRKTDRGVPYIDEQTVWSWVKDFYIAGISMSFKEWFDAMRVEVSVRALFWPRVPVTQDTRNKDKTNEYLSEKRRKLDIAEHILKWGVMKHPQSSYLQLQFMGFRIYREQVDKGLNSRNASDKTIYIDVVSKLEEIEKLGLTVDLQFALFRKRKDLEHLRDTLGDKDVNSVSYEEVKKRQRAAHQAHERTVININNVWKALKQRRNASSNDIMTTLLERVWESEQVATEAYEYVVERCSAQGLEASSILEQYAKFLRDVKRDRTAYMSMMTRAQLSSVSRDSTSHQSGSQASQDNAAISGKEDVVKDGQQQISTLKGQLRSATFVLMACVTVLFVVFYILAGQYRDLLLNVDESGARRSLTMRAVKYARDMHYSAYHYKIPVSDAYAAAESISCPRDDLRCGIAVAKRYPLCTVDQLAYYSTHPGGPTSSWPADKICAPDVCCFELFGPSLAEPFWSASAYTAHEDLQYYEKKLFEESAKKLDASMEDFKYFHNNLVKTYRTDFKPQGDFYDRVNDKINVYIADPDPTLPIGRRPLQARHFIHLRALSPRPASWLRNDGVPQGRAVRGGSGCRLFAPRPC
jgi:hypothetical protein